MAPVTNILLERSYRESRGGSLPAAHISCVTHGGLGKLLRGELQAWLFLFPKRSMTAMTAHVTQPLRATGGHPACEQPVLHSSLDHDSRWQGFLLTHLAFYMLNI